jgi:stearoyl-CoA desaturase (delta-9 desaturase)
MGWVLYGDTWNDFSERQNRFIHAPDLAKQPFYVWLTQFHYVPQIVVALILLALGGWPMVWWGIFLRTTLTWHVTWLVNSATHVWGYRRFKSNDDSRNLWWVALLAFGEGWHNNHHAHAASARHGLAWYEFDLNWLVIRTLEILGIAKNVRAVDLATAPRKRSEDPEPAW